VAALILKNSARMLLKSPGYVVEYVKANVLDAVRDTSAMIRSNSGTLIASLLALFEPQNWPQGLFYLVTALDAPDTGAREVCGFTRAHIQCSLVTGCYRCAR
jgi:transportin-1